MSGHPFPFRFAGLLVAGLGMAALPSPASAAFSVCNKTTHAASVALGYYDGKEWSSTGWWTVAAGACTRLVSEPLTARYYYVYALHHDVGGAWAGDRSFCTQEEHFVIQGRNDCVGKGYQVKKFFQVDTGQAPDWTENLSD